MDQTECRKYLLRKDAATALHVSKNDVGKMIHGSMFNDLLKAIEPTDRQLRLEVGALTGSTPTAFQCGKGRAWPPNPLSSPRITGIEPSEALSRKNNIKA